MKNSDWTHSICDDCWDRKNPDRTPVRIRGSDNRAELCCYCRIPTTSGIYVRDDPALFSNCDHNVTIIVRHSADE